MDSVKFDISDLDTAYTAEMVVMAFGRPTPWIWILSGPGHPKTIAQSDREQRRALVEEKLIKQAQVNGRKWTAEEVTVEERRANNVTWIIERLVGWKMADGSPVTLGGKPFPFSEENARAVLSDRAKVNIYGQVLDFLGGESAFMKRSATISAPSPSEPSSSTLPKKGEPDESA